MNKGFKYYFIYGKKQQKQIFKHFSNYFKFYLYYFMKLIGYAIPFLSPIFLYSDIRMAKIANEENDIDIFESFKGCSSTTRYFHAFICDGLYYLYLTGALLMAFVLFLLISLLIPLISSNPYNNQLLLVIFLIPIIILLIGFMINISLTYNARGYLLDTNEVTFNEAFAKSKYFMNSKAKKDIFLMSLFSYLKVILVLIVLIVIAYLLQSTIFIVFYTILAFILIFFFIPKVVMQYKVAKLKYFFDLINIEEYPVIIKDINIDVFKDNNPVTLRNDLTRLFEESEKEGENNE